MYKETLIFCNFHWSQLVTVYGSHGSEPHLFTQMADTTVRPRPAFSTFLKSDAEDSLAFYQQKAFLRRTKTVSLQQKREENEALKVKALEEYRLLQHGGGYRARHLTEPSVTLKERKSKSANLHRHVAWQTNCEQESSIREDIDRNRPKTAGDPTPGNKQSWSETKQGNSCSLGLKGHSHT